MITVTPRARIREDRAGDPLDGLVNLFDLGIVLSVAFLLAALSSHNLTGVVTGRTRTPSTPPAATVPLSPGQTLHPIPVPSGAATGPGVPVGTVYRLPDGRLVYVSGSPHPAP